MTLINQEFSPGTQNMVVANFAKVTNKVRHIDLTGHKICDLNYSIFSHQTIALH